MHSSNVAQAVSEWIRVLGEEFVLTDAASLAKYAANAGGVKRMLSAVLRPGSTDDVVNVVAVANRHKVPLHPVSLGRNWGLGSCVPVRDGAVVVELGRMNAIREVNLKHHYAVVEPGVTQRQLYDYIRERNLPLVMNVTGAAGATSLIGNAMERGVGYFASRAEALTGLEVVLGNGTLLKTGFGHFENAQAKYIYKFGIGPFLDGLFSQGNFGIVTSAAVDLMPKRDAHMAVIAKIRDPEKLGAFVEAIADLRRRDVIQTVMHIGNHHRTQIAMAPLVYLSLKKQGGIDEADLKVEAGKLLAKEGFGAWSAVGGIMGTRGHLAATRREIRKSLRGLAKTMFMTDALVNAAKSVASKLSFIPWVRRKQALLLAVEPLYGLAKGIPTDAPMNSVWWPLGEVPRTDRENPDQSHCGLLFCVPFFPADGEVVAKAMQHVEKVFRKYNFVPYITLNMADSKSIECVINLAFDRNHPSQVAAAHACNDELTSDFIKQGLIPYRVGVQSMDLVVRENDTYWNTVRDLKKALDPNHIISPGRYNLV